MHYKNGRPAKVGDWVIGKTHNSGEHLRVCFVKELMPANGQCNVKLHVWLGSPSDYCGGYQPPKPRYELIGQDDYAYTANLIHVVDGYRLAVICAEAWQWDSPLNPSPIIAP